MATKIQIKFNAKHLVAALARVGVVSPRPLNPQGATGYLIVVREGSAWVYSRDVTHVARAKFPVTDVVSEGMDAFIYPAKHVSGFGFLGDAEVTLTATSDGDTHRVSYTSTSGAGSDRATYDPRSLATIDRDLESAQNERTYPPAVLKDAFTQVKPFLSKPGEAGAEEANKGVQIFDGKDMPSGRGYAYANNGTVACYYQTPVFEDKGLLVHGSHLPLLTAFLSKAEGVVTFKDGANMTFAEDAAGSVLGWAHHTARHTLFKLPNLDSVALTVPTSVILGSLRYVRAEMDAKQSKVRVQYDAAAQELRFTAVGVGEKLASFPVPVACRKDFPEGFTAHFNLTWLLEIFNGQGNEMELRARVLGVSERHPRGKVLLGTVDEYILDNESGKVVAGAGVETVPEGATRCQITRFTSSID